MEAIALQPRRGAPRDLLRERLNDVVEDGLAISGETKVILTRAEALTAYTDDAVASLDTLVQELVAAYRLNEAIDAAKVEEIETALGIAKAAHQRSAAKLAEAEKRATEKCAETRRLTEHMRAAFTQFDHDVIELEGSLVQAAERAGFSHVHAALKAPTHRVGGAR